MFVFRYLEHVWDFEFRSRAAQALAPRVEIYLIFVIWNFPGKKGFTLRCNRFFIRVNSVF